jgi:hypothetical protein
MQHHTQHRQSSSSGVDVCYAEPCTEYMWVRHFVAFLTAQLFAVYACDEQMFNSLPMVLPILPDFDLQLMLPSHAIDDATPL